VSGRKSRTPEIPEISGAWQSQAIFAAMLAAVRGDDTKAGDILREVAKSLEDQFAGKGGGPSG